MFSAISPALTIGNSTAYYHHSITMTESEDQLTPGQLEAILISGLATSIFSLIGCLFNLTATLLLKVHRHTLGKMVILLSIMDSIYNVVGIAQTFKVSSSNICQVQSFFVAFGYCGSLAWTCCFAHSLYVTLKQENIEQYFKKYNLVSFFAAIGLGLLAITIRFQDLDEETHTCWPKRAEGLFDWAFIIMILTPTAVSVVYCTVCYSSVISKIREFGGKVHRELLLYPLIMIICFTPFTALRMYIQITQSNYGPFWLELASISLANSQGLLNAFAYGLSGTLKGGCKAICRKRSNSMDQPLYEENSLNSVHY